ncbi:Sodium channel protein type 10 subunit alpha [Durusdinium trenchii]|uniref:Sodium channel protein type 10 subunit alpha n=1 Tax=Durusdinium trenchii TaxID=1381693 RepID=A0ABP0Q106_9DINO
MSEQKHSTFSRRHCDMDVVREDSKEAAEEKCEDVHPDGSVEQPHSASLSHSLLGESQGEGPCEASIRRGPSSFSISSLNDTEKSEKDRWAIQQKLILRKLDVQDQKLAQILDMMKRMAPPELKPLKSPDRSVPASPPQVRPRISSGGNSQGSAMTPIRPRTPRLFTTSKQEEDMHRFKAASKDGANARRRFADLHIDAQSESQKSWSLRVVTHPGFDIFFALVVLTNSAYIGVEVQYSMSQPSEAELLPFHIIGTFYTILFTAELIMRIWAYGVKSFFCDEDWAWSLLDFFIVATSLFELVSFILQVVSNISGSTNMSGISSLKAFRIIRLTRLLKTVRLMRIFRFVLALRMLVTSIFHTLKSLFWALVLLLLIVYVFAVLFVQAVQDYLEESRDLLDDLELRACELYFQSLGHTMITLFMSISGGVSWENALLPLMKMSPLWVGCFIFFVAFTYFAVLNVITAVFCESAIESAQSDQFTVVQSILADKENHLQKVRNLFARLGANADSGSITFSMLESQINSPAVHEYFTSLGLDIWDAWTFFRLLDADGGGEVEVEEFLMGCLRLRGPATAIDMGKVLRDQNWVVQTLGRFSAYVEGELQHVKLMLEAERSSPDRGTR